MGDTDTTANIAAPTTPPEQVAPHATPAEGTAAATSPADIEKLLTERDARLLAQFEEREARLRETLEEEGRRARQSLRSVGDSIVTRVQERTAVETRALDELVEEGLMTREERDARVMRAQQRITGEETRKFRDEQTLSQRQFAEQERQRVIDEAGRIVQKSGLAESDPEWSSLPLERHGNEWFLPGVLPDEAIKLLNDSVGKAIAAKTARVEAENKAKLAQAQAAAVHVDLGGGGGAATRTAEAVQAELNAEFSKPATDWDHIASLRKELDKLT